MLEALQDREFIWLIAGLLVSLGVASLIGFLLARRTKTDKQREVVGNLNDRIRAWWVMIAVFLLAVIAGPLGSVFLFALISFLALREYMALAPTAKADHGVLLWLFFVILPVHYVLLGMQWYGLFAVFIPVYAFIWLQIRAALTGVTENFLDRTARVQWGLMVAVYFVSYAPALLMLEIPDYSTQGQNFKLLLFLAIVVQISDVLQYVAGKLFGRHPIAPNVSPNKTVEGFVGGVGAASLVGASLFWMTPFTFVEAFLMSLVICLLGFAGGLIMSATKRDRKVKDFGALLPGHGGILDRIDSLCFAAPVFFHLTRYFYG